MLRQLLALAAVVAAVAGHGRLLGPPGRSSIWRSGFPGVENYDDDGLNCGGFSRQHDKNGGKCGICGDAFDLPKPRPNELGGLYGEGIIVNEYEEGQVIPVTIEITAYHRGFWELKICPDPNSTDQSCFDKHPVELEKGGTKYGPTKDAVYNVNYRLPKGLVCEHCVLQWRYTAGNNWGYCDDGTAGLGCGNQENFLSCADISIKPSADSPPEVTSSEEVDQDLFELLHNIILKPPPKKTNTKYALNKKKNHRQPRSRDKHTKLNQDPFWQFF